MALGPESILLTDRVAVVTGAAAGIGAAVAVALARFGADVHLADRDADGLAAVAEEVKASGRSCTTAQLDVRDGEAVAGWAASVSGPVHVLVNNAGGGFQAAFESLSERGQAALIAENFTSVADVTRAFLPALADGAAVVNITSVEAHRAAPGFAVYAAMKAAVVNLTRSLALELGDRGIRVNCVAPDVIPTPGVGAMEGVRTPLGGVGHVDDVAAAVVYLASDFARFVTGTTVHVDGGTAAAGGWRRQDDGTWTV